MNLRISFLHLLERKTDVGFHRLINTDEISLPFQTGTTAEME
jgi:hypothetical protein